MYVARSVQPSSSAHGFTTLSGHFASGLYSFHAAATAASALGAWRSMSAMAELPSGASRMMAGPRTAILQPAGAMKRLPAVVVLGVSRASRSAFVADAAELAVFAGVLSGATAGLSESGVPLRQPPPSETRRKATIVA